jgi:hypothetical protein
VKEHEALAPKAKQLLLRPFNGAHPSGIQAVAAVDKIGNVTYGDSTGFLNPSIDTFDGKRPGIRCMSVF